MINSAYGSAPNTCHISFFYMNHSVLFPENRLEELEQKVDYLQQQILLKAERLYQIFRLIFLPKTAWGGSIYSEKRTNKSTSNFSFDMI